MVMQHFHALQLLLGNNLCSISALISNSGANDKYSIRVTDNSHLVTWSQFRLRSNRFEMQPNSLGIIHDIDRGTKTFTVAFTKTKDANDTLSFAVDVLPSNMSMSTAGLGVISGTPTQLSI